MNRIWSALMLIGVIAMFFVKPQDTLEGMIDAVNNALKLSFSLMALYAIWLGILNILEQTGFNKKLSVGLRPMIYFLFGRVSDTTAEYISMNIAANLLGMGNAATPMGIKAINSMDDQSGVATDAMIMLFVINASSIQILPTTIISLRTALKSASPADIILPTIITSFISTLSAVLLVKIIIKIKNRKRRREYD
ncbi:MAG TPA: spore maturation protein [Clostridiales bacterium]|jgi:spore maturation protein A|nr:spore maturation protein [Clostridiales bacterium]